MKKYTLLILVFVCIISIFISAQEKNIGTIKNDIIIDILNKYPEFQRWINFWKIKIPELEHLEIEKIDTIKWRSPYKIDLNKWLEEKKFREYTLDFSPQRNYVIDIYSSLSFEYKNDSIFIMGGDIDPAFQIINLTDSVLYYFTLGPYSFFDESFWLSDSICFILGFISVAVDDAYKKVIMIKWDFEKESIMVYSGQKFLPYKKFLNIPTFIKYLYPELNW